MKLIFPLKISSISDVITNSSTEIFTIKHSEGVDRYLDTVLESYEAKDWCFQYYDLQTEEDVIDFLFTVASWNRLDDYNIACEVKGGCTQATYDKLIEDNVSKEEIWEKYKTAYSPLIGMLVTEASNEDVTDWDDDGVDYDVLRTLSKHGGNSYRMS